MDASSMQISAENKFLPLLNDYLEKWARERPDKIAMIEYDTGLGVTYREFARRVDQYAAALLAFGIRPGDRVAAMLFLSPELVYLMYACLKIGAIFATIDIRLKDQEVVADLKKIDPSAFFFLGKTDVRDFRWAGRAAIESCPSVRIAIQVPVLQQQDELIPQAISLDRFAQRGVNHELDFGEQIDRYYNNLTKRSAGLIIFTTGTTGPPKPAVLCHENVIVQNEIFARGGKLSEHSKVLINLPPSHVGCLTACLTTMVHLGGSAVLQKCFEPKATLDAIQAYKVNVLAQIPTQYRMLWAEECYANYDLSSLDLVIFGGASGDLPLIKNLARMAPRFATGIGMTETAGFCTFSQSGISPEEMDGQVGRCYPDLASVTIRAPMRADGAAGPELPDGELGEICHHPPLVFLGYYNQPEETAKAISKEGILYSGDLGYTRDMGAYKAIYIAGRRKHIIKQSGYNVFPDEVEAHLSMLNGVRMSAVVGLEHRLLGEGILAFVQPHSNAEITEKMIMQHCKRIASYKRPQHVVIWPPERSFPLTRSSKIDKTEMKEIARNCIEQLRAQGLWDRPYAKSQPIIQN